MVGLLKHFFEVEHDVGVLGCDEGVGDTLLAGSASTANTMGVPVVVRVLSVISCCGKGRDVLRFRINMNHVEATALSMEPRGQSQQVKTRQIKRMDILSLRTFQYPSACQS